MARKKDINVNFKVKDTGTAVIKKSAADVDRSMRKMRKSADSATKKLTKGLKGLRSAGKAAAIGLGVATAAVGALALAAKSLVNIYAEQEAAEFRLQKAMQLSGDYTEDAYKSMLEYASALQETSVYGDELVLMNAAMLKSFGLTNEEVKETIDAAADLASALDKDLNTAVDALGRTMVGETEALKQFGIEIEKTDDGSVNLSRALEAVGKAYKGTAAEFAKTTAGQLRQLSNTWGDLKETLGAIFAPSFVSLAKQLKRHIEDIAFKIVEWVEANKELINNMPKTMMTIMNNVKTAFGYVGKTVTKLESLMKFFSDRNNKAILPARPIVGADEIIELEDQTKDFIEELNKAAEKMKKVVPIEEYVAFKKELRSLIEEYRNNQEQMFQLSAEVEQVGLKAIFTAHSLSMMQDSIKNMPSLPGVSGVGASVQQLQTDLDAIIARRDELSNLFSGFAEKGSENLEQLKALMLKAVEATNKARAKKRDEVRKKELTLAEKQAQELRRIALEHETEIAEQRLAEYIEYSNKVIALEKQTRDEVMVQGGKQYELAVRLHEEEYARRKTLLGDSVILYTWYHNELNRLAKENADEQKRIEDEKTQTIKDNLASAQDEFKKTYDEYMANRSMTEFGSVKITVDGIEEIEEVNRVFDNFAYGVQQAEAELKSWGALYIRLGREVADVISNEMTSAIVAFAESNEWTWENASKYLVEFAQNMTKWLAEMYIKELILQGLKSMGDSSAANAGAIAGNTAELASVEALIVAYNQLAIAKLAAGISGGGDTGGAGATAMAAGGPMSAGQTYLVGEEGPELFTPNKSGYLFNNDETQGMMGGSGNDGKSVEFNIVNITSNEQLNAWAASKDADNAVLNIIGRNPKRARALLRS